MRNIPATENRPAKRASEGVPEQTHSTMDYYMGDSVRFQVILPSPRAFQLLGAQGLVGTANAFAAKRMPLTLQPGAHGWFFFSSTAANGFITAFYEMM